MESQVVFSHKPIQIEINYLSIHIGEDLKVLKRINSKKMWVIFKITPWPF